jgi:hypothetical protein
VFKAFAASGLRMTLSALFLYFSPADPSLKGVLKSYFTGTETCSWQRWLQCHPWVMMMMIYQHTRKIQAHFIQYNNTCVVYANFFSCEEEDCSLDIQNIRNTSTLF